MKHWLRILLAVSLLAAGMNAALADTFIGNGGGAGDNELAVTKKQIEETFRTINRHFNSNDGEKNEIEDFAEADAELCKCNRTYANRSVCEPVRSLTDEQRKYCSKVMRSQTYEILRLVTQEEAVRFRWTNEPIRVAERGQTRAVDAVTNREKSEVTINLKRFLELKPFERVFLVTHELFHLTSVDGKPLEDDGAIGPFTGEGGGRRLLNSVGATAAMLQAEYPSEIKLYRARLNRSQGFKSFWIDVNIGQANGDAVGTFSSDSFSRSQLSLRYALGNFVLVGAYGSQTSDKKALGTVSVDEKRDILSVGLGYRLFPFGDPETFWGQSHFLLQATADRVDASLKLSETIVISDSKKFWGATAALNYYVPVFWGFWGYAGFAYEMHPYKYQSINVKYEKNILSSYLGVAYGF